MQWLGWAWKQSYRARLGFDKKASFKIRFKSVRKL